MTGVEPATRSAGVPVSIAEEAQMPPSIEEVTIPLVWEAPPVSCRLVRWLVRDGEHVCNCQGIYELEVDGTVCEVDSFFTGHMKQLVPDDTICNAGDRVARIVLDEMSTRFKTLPLYLSGNELACLDAIRGDTPREVFVRDALLRCIATAQNNSGQGGGPDSAKPVDSPASAVESFRG